MTLIILTQTINSPRPRAATTHKHNGPAATTLSRILYSLPTQFITRLRLVSYFVFTFAVSVTTPSRTQSYVVFRSTRDSPSWGMMISS